MILGGASSSSKRVWTSALGLFLALMVSRATYAVEEDVPSQGIPECPSHALRSQNSQEPANIVGNNNAQVVGWKASSQNQFHDRAHVQGNVVRVYPDRNGHSHFAIQIGPNPSDTIEVIYNMEFGSVPQPSVGTPVEACGDYITSTGPSPAPGGQTYPASPDGAIVHWVHMAPARSGHNSGYLVVGGVLTGQGSGNPHGGHGGESSPELQAN